MQLAHAPRPEPTTDDDRAQRMSALRRIDSPGDLRALPSCRLLDVASELRAELIELGASRGGHFGGSLGTVELSIALHYLFDTPRDRLIWDVGHQAYGHKALTGRREALARIKQASGPSGFLRRSESAYDVFGAGHAGTSLSAALGIAEGIARLGGDAKVVAVIGDGAATAGMAFEALNHAGGLGANLRVVYNDNGMSIAPSVGGLAKSKDPRSFFESLGWKYFGPVDGHLFAELLPALEGLRDTRGPSLLHVRTRKGCGYPPAEADPYRWHATTPFDVASGETKMCHLAVGGESAPTAPPSYTEAFADALSRLADRDEGVVAITAAMPDGTGLDSFARRHPNRVYDVGIAEQHAVTFAAGLATEGFRPVCAIYSTFLQRAFDQIVHDVALQSLPVVFALDRAGLVGADGPTHHGVLDFAYLRAIPNLVIAVPRDENELQHLLATGLECGGPFAIRFPRGAARGVLIDPDPKALPIGRASMLRSGDDVAIVAVGKALLVAEEAAQELARLGVEATLIDARFVKPLDGEMLTDAARRCGLVVTLEDHMMTCGFGSAVLELLATRLPGTTVRVIGLPDAFVEHGDVNEQWREAGMDTDSVVARVLGWLES